MKFGRTLHQHVVPAWANSYIDYDRLKTILASGEKLPVFASALRSEADLVNAFCSDTTSHLQRRLDTVSKRYSIKIGSSEARIFDSVSKPELVDLQLSLVEITEQLVQLEWHWRVNDEAINLLIDKAVAVYGDADAIADESLIPSQVDTKTPCQPQLELVNATLDAVHKALGEKQEQRRRSLFFERVVAKSSRRSAFTDVLLAVHEDDEPALYPLTEEGSSSLKPLLLAFLQVAIAHRSLGCQRLLLSALSAQVHVPVSTKHDYLHRIIRRLRGADPEKAALEFKDALDALAPNSLLFVESFDARGRLPLHHAAELGLGTVCREIWARAKAWNRMLLWTPDAAGATPLDLAVCTGHASTVSTLLYHTTTSQAEAGRLAMSPMLRLAIMSGFEDIAQALIARGWGLDSTMRDGRTALHLAAEQGLPTIAESVCNTKTRIDSRAYSRRRTPLILAAIQGHAAVVATLLEKGADTAKVDANGWSAKDHAAFRGFLDISRSLGPAKATPLRSKPPARRGTSNVLPSNPHPSESVIFVTPGTTDLFKPTPFVDVSPLRAKLAPLQVPDTSLWLTVSGLGCRGEAHSVRLPALEDRADWPWMFPTRAPDDAKLVFRLYSQFHKGPVGTAVAMLASLKKGLGPGRESLVRDFTLAFVDPDADFVGEVTFTFLVAKPCAGKVPVAYDQELYTPEFTEVGGHRGNGWNDGNRDSLQIGENTIQSFRTAADLGATVVEFDVQLTKDHVPMVYHDFLVAEAGLDAAMHNLTYNQFMALSDPRFCVEHANGGTKRLPWDERDRPRLPHRQRSRSICAHDDSAAALASRMSRTQGYPGWKANLRNENIFEPFVTLTELYQNLSEDIPLSIEIKYPMLSESQDFLLDPFAPELNTVIDTVLDITAAHAGPRRRITLSSFSPEVCMAVAVKQRGAYPVLFLNDSCNGPTGDLRATSVQMAARQAHRFGHDGVGEAAEPFVEAPGLIPLVKGQGLYTMSYGVLNDSVENSKMQARLGIDLLFVNKVKLIKKALDEVQPQECF